MKRAYLFAVVAAMLSVAVWSGSASAEDKPAPAPVTPEKTAPKTVSGKSECATCSGVTAAGHSIMLVDRDGTRWVLLGDSESYKKAHEVRKAGKQMTATLAGDPVTKKDATGKEYKEVKVSDVKIG